MFDVNTSVVDEEYGDLDEERLAEYVDALMTEFEDSPEGGVFRDQHAGALGYAALYMEYLAQYEGLSVAEALASDTQEVVFHLFPRKVSVDACEAEEIIDELRAFWQFLKRTRGLPQADEVLELLGEGAVERLEDELADEGNFGMAKSFFMAGKTAGFDMTTQEGLDRFLAVYNAGLLQAHDTDEDLDDAPADEYARLHTAPIHNETPKVGRNEPCPCGSGRKYKKCCGGQ